ncbi:grasp-with-spasm system SPASM domain peptide maturase [Pontibacter silvestris]|uniref:Grasp-with-spasm system SPASM domain peptide maturase n=1 Tax=Pontibacter silvestris TaxID=2305183 RepID=A0ABW4X1L6_9BACT|nr:grasp-with-spasm system SPASM domain peptide maturase [Pontibacter silvestris]MCC9138811.1 grasp-with-spasm system SPASM domain peptide maturase [Pontibacter silvestris]
MISLEQHTDHYFYLYANCFVTRGFSRSTIIDVAHKNLYFIDNAYCDLISRFRVDKIGAVINSFEAQKDVTYFLEFLNFLQANNLGTFVQDITLFPAISLDWDHPSKVTNAIIDSRNINHDFEDILKQLDDLGCLDVQLRFYEKTEISYLESILELTAPTAITAVQMIIRYNALIDSMDYHRLVKKYPVLDLIIVYGSPENKFLEQHDDVREVFKKVLFTTQAVDSCASCGTINLRSMSIPDSVQGYAENVRHNSCLNRKVSVDENGDIKNCPSLPRSFGNVKDTPIARVLEDKDFIKAWNISKESITVCKDCEFRNICSDCRAYTSIPGDILSKPAKCTYDPYLANFA